MIKVKRSKATRVVQGDILRNVELIENVTERDGVMEVSKILFPFAVVLTQDCDLEQEYNQRWRRNSKAGTDDKWLLSVLVAPLYIAAQCFAGTHLHDIGRKMQVINETKSPGKSVKNNTNPRYHYLEFRDDMNLNPMLVDFKHYFAISTEYARDVKRSNFVGTIGALYREDLSQRFASFLSRVGLP